jgi:hypothetical protein
MENPIKVDDLVVPSILRDFHLQETIDFSWNVGVSYQNVALNQSIDRWNAEKLRKGTLLIGLKLRYRN